MKRLRLFAVLLIIPIIGLTIGCNESSTEPETQPVNEAEVLLAYLEANGDYLNTSAPSIVAASDVYTALGGGTQYVIDVRSSTGQLQRKGTPDSSRRHPLRYRIEEPNAGMRPWSGQQLALHWPESNQ